MRPAGATFWRLGGLSGWQKRTASADLAVSDRQGLRLAAAEGGPLSLQSADGSFGGLTLPRGMALDRGLTLYLLGSDGATIKRYDGETRTFVPYARLEGASSIAIVRDWLYVARPAAGRVDVFDLTRSLLVDVLEAGDWQPADLAPHDGAVYILDVHRGRVFRHAPYEPLELELERADRAGVWSRLVLDRDGTLYLFDGQSLELRDRDAPPVTDAGAIRDLFDPPILRLDESGRFCLPATMAGVCGRSVPSPGPPPEVQLSRCIPSCEAPKPAEPALAARGDFLLYVVRRTKRRVDAYTDDGRHLRHSWGACMDWQPCDVAACGGTAFILDEQNQIVYRHTAGRESLKRLIHQETPNRYWARLVCDGGMLLLYRPGAKSVQVFDCSGRPRGERCYEDVRALFEAQRPDAPAPIENGLFFDRDGNPVTVDFSNPSGTRLYNKSGSWQSAPLDSQKYRCQWHRIELQLTSFPPGSRISVATCALERPEDIDDPARARFVDAQTIVAPIVAPIGGAQKSFDFLVQSGLGQHLTVRLKLESDGFSTPAVESAKIHYPRESYLEYLPSTYAADDESRIFLERFLSIFQTEWDTLDKAIDEIEARFDPDAVPEGDFLDHLAAQWLALPLEGDWDGKQRRRLVSAIPKIYPHRGQLRGLRDFIAVYLANMAGLETEAVRQLEFPVIIEGFREREFLFGSKGEASRLGTGAPLWSASVKRRLQLGVYSTEGEAELVSSGDPEHDVFAEYAHRFRVYVPGAWVRSAANERMLRRALDAEKPAQTHYDLCLIEPRFRIGAQSTIGVDTVIGAAPSLRLGCPSCSDAAPSLPPLGRLGYDTVLSTDARANAELVLA